MSKIELATREAARLAKEKWQAMSPHDQRMGTLIDQYRAINDVLDRHPLLVEMTVAARMWATTCAGTWLGEFGAARCFAFSDLPSNPRASTWWQE